MAVNDQQLVLLGAGGAALDQHCNTAESGQAHPLVADLNGDGFGELIATSSSRQPIFCQSSQNAGIAVFAPVEPITRTRSVGQPNATAC